MAGALAPEIRLEAAVLCVVPGLVSDKPQVQKADLSYRALMTDLASREDLCLD
jgi:hypothetical protein